MQRRICLLRATEKNGQIFEPSREISSFDNNEWDGVPKQVDKATQQFRVDGLLFSTRIATSVFIPVACCARPKTTSYKLVCRNTISSIDHRFLFSIYLYLR